jgi:hypothetical protein
VRGRSASTAGRRFTPERKSQRALPPLNGRKLSNNLLTDPRSFDILTAILARGDRMQFDQLKRRDFNTLPGGTALGAVHTWHFATQRNALNCVRSWGHGRTCRPADPATLVQGI